MHGCVLAPRGSGSSHGQWWQREERRERALLGAARRHAWPGRARRHLVRPDRGRPRCATASAAERTTAAATAGRRFAVVLFTDMVDSTELASEIGDARWRQVLDEHDALCARIVKAHGGRVVKQMGDGVLALFEQTGRAVVAALDLRMRWPSWVSPSGLGSMPPRLSCAATTSLASRFTSPSGSKPPRSPGKCWSRRPSWT